MYILVKGNIIEVNTYAIQLFHRVNVFSDSSDTNCNVYPKAAFMTVFALILRLLSEGGYYEDHDY